jgi:hypothetical protein
MWIETRMHESATNFYDKYEKLQGNQGENGNTSPLTIGP